MVGRGGGGKRRAGEKQYNGVMSEKSDNDCHLFHSDRVKESGRRDARDFRHVIREEGLSIVAVVFFRLLFALAAICFCNVSSLFIRS